MSSADTDWPRLSRLRPKDSDLLLPPAPMWPSFCLTQLDTWPMTSLIPSIRTRWALAFKLHSVQNSSERRKNWILLFFLFLGEIPGYVFTNSSQNTCSSGFPLPQWFSRTWQCLGSSREGSTRPGYFVRPSQRPGERTVGRTAVWEGRSSCFDWHRESS